MFAVVLSIIAGKVRSSVYFFYGFRVAHVLLGPPPHYMRFLGSQELEVRLTLGRLKPNSSVLAPMMLGTG
jgi:hypothetical protein